MNNLASYGGYRSWGAPLIAPDGTLDTAKVARLARYGTCVIHANVLHTRPDVTAALREAGAKRILPYVTLTHWWLGADFTPQATDHSFNAEWHRAIQRTGGFLPNPQQGYEVDWTNATTAAALTELLVMMAGSGLYDGIFMDYASPEWEPTKAIERQAAMADAVAKVAEAGGDYFLIVGNGIGAHALQFDERMAEGFPQPFTSFDKALNMNPYRWLKCEDTNPRAGRFGYCTALLTGATFCWGPQSPSSFDGDRWLPEFDVDLGEPRGSYLKLTSGVYARWFDKGLVMVNPTWEPCMLDLLAPTHERVGLGPSRYITVPAWDAVVMVRA